jgi:hypothetical protein
MKINFVEKVSLCKSFRGRPAPISCLAISGAATQCTATPSGYAMTEARNFIAALARAGKSHKEINPLVDVAYGA